MAKLHFIGKEESPTGNSLGYVSKKMLKSITSNSKAKALKKLK